MVIKTHRLARPVLALAAIAIMALVAIPSASIADTFPGAYPQPTQAPKDSKHTVRDVVTTVAVGGVVYWLFADNTFTAAGNATRPAPRVR